MCHGLQERTRGNKLRCSSVVRHELRYDVQMPVETVDTAERHTVGARGLDVIERTTSSGTGRFLSQDTSKGGDNWYVYGANNPITCGDASGHDAMNIYTQTFIISMTASFFAALGLDWGGSGFQARDLRDVLGAATSGVKGAAVATFAAFLFKFYFGSEGVASRIPMRIGFTRGLAKVASGSFLGGIAVGAIWYYGKRAGEIMYELAMMEDV